MSGRTDPAGRRVLIVDDDTMLTKAIQRWATSWSATVACLHDARHVTEAVAEFMPQVILLDLHMPGVDGPAALRTLAHAGCSARIVLMSGAGGDVLQTCHEMGKDFGLRMGPSISKPFALQSLAAAIGTDTLEAGPRPRGPVANRLLPVLGAAEVRTALAAGEIQAWLQPKVDLRSGRLVGAEALARWVRDGKVVAPPDDFIPVAERSNLIDDLTMALLDGVVAFLATVDNEVGDEFSISVNISPLSLRDPALADRLAAHLDRTGVPASRIVYEITESASLSDATRAMETLSRLRLRGHRLSLDDFGTGTSSLVQLYRMPFTEVKVDRSFVEGIHERRDAAVIVRTILSMARELGLHAVAEGVEDARTARWLLEHGCPVGQGWHFGRAMSTDQFRAWMRDVA